MTNFTFQTQLKEIGRGIKSCAKSCQYFNVCGGGSPSNKYFETGSFESTETDFCYLTQQVMTDLLIDKLSQLNGSLDFMSECA